MDEIRAHRDVIRVEADKPVYIRTKRHEKRDIITQKVDNPFDPKTIFSWGLEAVSHRKFTENYEYIYSSRAGNGTYAYVVDSGVRATHIEYKGCVVNGFSAFNKSGVADFIDNVGHGTHVAGTIAGTGVGVSKLATIVAVKVVDQASSNSGANVLKNKRQTKAVINISLEADYSQTMNDLVEKASKDNVIFAVGAGNYSPASAKSALTVSSIQYGWSMDENYANYGTAVDILAPGDSIFSADYVADDKYVNLDGTSMVAPHVASLVLYYMSVEGISGTDALTKRILATATKDKVGGNLRGSPNLLANNNNPKEKNPPPRIFGMSG
ncbi:hypothetical protein VHEMI08028 [[Torrubiella] hemipterigena]|uniref:Peptidase S8/S53 domain-containing protein n=1 Tax=[Torrubiella] hemipterigena TaxID=1531966 RepID=A0A0A1TNZ0_9HYPO|nr:hypothetical protein VHEMI08028 [[Torrubiella] hemipterigena]